MSIQTGIRNVLFSIPVKLAASILMSMIIIFWALGELRHLSFFLIFALIFGFLGAAPVVMFMEGKKYYKLWQWLIAGISTGTLTCFIINLFVSKKYGIIMPEVVLIFPPAIGASFIYWLLSIIEHSQANE